jgi:opine dehydrogenase
VPNASVVVVGGGCAALTLAGRLALDGHRVVLWEAPSAGDPILAPCERPQIKLNGAGGEAVATLAAATCDPFEALAAGDVLLACTPPHEQSTFTDLLLPLIEPRHTLVLLPGNLVSLAHAKWLRDRGRGAGGLPTLVESDTAPVVGHMLEPDRVHMSAVVANPGFGVFPACRTDATMTVLRQLFPGARAYAHVVAAALAAPVPFLRAPALLMNAGAVERRRAGFSLFEDGFTPGVARVAEALDAERLALAAALGFDLPTAAEALHALGLGPLGDLWATVNGSFALTQAFESDSPCAEQLGADVTFCLRPWVELAKQLDVPAPICRSLLALYDAATGSARGDSGRSLDDLGIAGMTAAALGRFLDTGNGEPRA